MSKPSKTYSISLLVLLVTMTELLFWAATLVSYYVLSADEEFRLENAGAVALFAFIPLIIGVFIYYAIRGNTSLNRLSETPLRSSLTKGASNWRLLLKYLLFFESF